MNILFFHHLHELNTILASFLILINRLDTKDIKILLPLLLLYTTKGEKKRVLADLLSMRNQEYKSQ